MCWCNNTPFGQMQGHVQQGSSRGTGPPITGRATELIWLWGEGRSWQLLRSRVEGHRDRTSPERRASSSSPEATAGAQNVPLQYWSHFYSCAQSWADGVFTKFAWSGGAVSQLLLPASLWQSHSRLVSVPLGCVDFPLILDKAPGSQKIRKSLRFLSVWVICRGTQISVGFFL